MNNCAQKTMYPTSIPVTLSRGLALLTIDKELARVARGAVQLFILQPARQAGSPFALPEVRAKLRRGEQVI